MVVSMATIDDHERKVCAEFAHLLEQSKNLFNGLRLVTKNACSTSSTFFSSVCVRFFLQMAGNYFCSLIVSFIFRKSILLEEIKFLKENYGFQGGNGYQTEVKLRNPIPKYAVFF